jgi:hypothetical protein
VPVAVNCWLVPFTIDAVAGVTDKEESTGAVTVSVAEPLMAPDVAVMVAPPCAALVASPPLLTVAVAVDDDIHIAALVRFCVVPLL